MSADMAILGAGIRDWDEWVDNRVALDHWDFVVPGPGHWASKHFAMKEACPKWHARGNASREMVSRSCSAFPSIMYLALWMIFRGSGVVRM